MTEVDPFLPRYDLLTDPLIRIVDRAGGVAGLTLPEILAAAMADGIETFPALRPHQRQPWHAFLCQLGAVACLRGEIEAPPSDPAAWRSLLEALTPDYPDRSPWCLLSPVDRPAFLQPPVPEGTVDGWRQVPAADALDYLVTAKAHDVKPSVASAATAEDWLFALLTLQTMEGFLGAGNYGIARMNGGFANRPAMGMAPAGGVGAHMRRDIVRLIELLTDADEYDRHAVQFGYGAYDEAGTALVWLLPWDGKQSLDPAALHPYFIEVCRRVRLTADATHPDGLTARVTNSKAARIFMDKARHGLTGDPWAPLQKTTEGTKVLTVDGRGFHYKRLAAILSAEGFVPSPMQTLGPEEIGDRPVHLVCRALVRGQGKTEGLHERVIPVDPAAQSLFRRGDDSKITELARISSERIQNIGHVEAALSLALMVLDQEGRPLKLKQKANPRSFDFYDIEEKSRRPAEAFNPDNRSSKKMADRLIERFDASVDADYFPQLFAEVAAPNAEAADRVRADWLRDLKARARSILLAAPAATPQSSLRSWRAWVRAEQAFEASFAKNLGHRLKTVPTAEESADAVA